MTAYRSDISSMQAQFRDMIGKGIPRRDNDTGNVRAHKVVVPKVTAGRRNQGPCKPQRSPPTSN